MAVVEHALREGRHLLVSAPSGVGKTTGALYPVLKYALAHDKRVFFVTAKNTQQQIVLETLQRMGLRESAHPNAVFFRARESMCINDVYACREEFCPHLRDFRVKLETTRVADRLLAERLITPDVLMEAGRGTSLCPFELALVEAELTDVIVCDYNYVFDPQVYLRRHFAEDGSPHAFLVDEAHNLVDRARDMFSAELDSREILAIRRAIQSAVPRCAKPGAPILVADLRRPPDPDAAGRLVEQYAWRAMPPLRRDFLNSLHAAYTAGEVQQQLREAGLPGFTVEEAGPLHLFVWGYGV